QVTVPAEHTETQGAVTFRKPCGAAEVRNVDGFFNEFAHDRVQEVNEELHGVRVFPFVKVQEVHAGQAAHERFIFGDGRHDFTAQVAGADFQALVAVNVGCSAVGVVREHDVGHADLGAGLQDAGPEGAFFGVAGDHFLEPGVTDGHAKEQILNLVPVTPNFQELFHVGVLDRQVGGERATTGGALLGDVDERVEQAHEIHRTFG